MREEMGMMRKGVRKRVGVDKGELKDGVCAFEQKG